MNPNPILQWLKSRKISTHTVAVLVSGAIVYYKTNTQFHDLVVSVHDKIPTWAMTLVMAGAFLYGWYRNDKQNLPPMAAK